MGAERCLALCAQQPLVAHACMHAWICTDPCRPACKRAALLFRKIFQQKSFISSVYICSSAAARTRADASTSCAVGLRRTRAFMHGTLHGCCCCGRAGPAGQFGRASALQSAQCDAASMLPGHGPGQQARAHRHACMRSSPQVTPRAHLSLARAGTRAGASIHACVHERRRGEACLALTHGPVLAVLLHLIRDDAQLLRRPACSGTHDASTRAAPRPHTCARMWKAAASGAAAMLPCSHAPSVCEQNAAESSRAMTSHATSTPACDARWCDPSEL